MDFTNVYEDAGRADSYAKLEFPGTYYLAYRDLPEIISEHVKGSLNGHVSVAVDFGCGAGRSTRLLKKLGFDTIGVDIAEDMIKKAREIDPEGDYRLIGAPARDDDSLCQLKDNSYDLVQSIFTFDNIPALENKATIFRQLGKLLKREGRLVNLVSSPEIYKNEWASFTTKDFPENRHAKSGDKVKIIMTDVDDRRPVEDIICSSEDYQEVYRKAGLEIVRTYTPLGKEDEPYPWVNETKIAPWVIYVLKKI
jgi:SAM-dependent methyltransferase